MKVLLIVSYYNISGEVVIDDLVTEDGTTGEWYQAIIRYVKATYDYKIKGGDIVSVYPVSQEKMLEIVESYNKLKIINSK